MTTEKIQIEIEANADQAEGALASFGQRLGSLGGSMVDVTGLAAKLGAVGFAGAAAAALTLTRNAANAYDALGKMAERTGWATESLSALQYAGELSDISVQTLDASLSKLSKGMADAARGQGEAAGAFRAMGISVTDANGQLRSSEEVFGDLADRFKQYRDGAEKAALAQALFGESGARLIPLLNGGRDGLREMREEAEQLGLVVSSDMTDQAERFNDSMTRIGKAAQGAGYQIANDLLPPLADLAEGLARILKPGGGGETVEIDWLNDWLDEVGERFANAGLKAEKARLSFLNAIGAGDSRMADLARAEIAEYEAGLARLGAKAQAERIAPRGATGAALEPRSQAAAPRVPEKAAGGKKKAEKDKWGTGEGFENFGAERLAADLAEQQALWDEQLEAADLNAQREMAARFNQIQLGLLTERELENHHYLEKRNSLLIAMEQEGADRTAHQEALAQLELQHQARLGDIEAQGTLARRRFEEMNAQQKTQFFFGQMAQMTAGVANQSRALFNIHKAAAIAEAAVSLPKGVQLTFDSYPWPWNIPAAAIHLATGLARIAQIKSAQFGTSSSPASVGGGSAAPVFVPAASPMTSEPAPPSVGQAAAPRTQVNLTLVGSTFSYKQVVEEIIPMINEAAGNGADIRVATA